MSNYEASAPSTALIPLGGKVIGISGDIVTLENAASTTVRVEVSGETTIVEEGAVKSAEQYQADLDAFRSQSQNLMQDPRTNEAALARLMAPSRTIETNLSLSALMPGETITVFVDGQNADATYNAYKIVVVSVNN